MEGQNCTHFLLGLSLKIDTGLLHAVLCLPFHIRVFYSTLLKIDTGHYDAKCMPHLPALPYKGLSTTDPQCLWKSTDDQQL